MTETGGTRGTTSRSRSSSSNNNRASLSHHHPHGRPERTMEMTATMEQIGSHDSRLDPVLSRPTTARSATDEEAMDGQDHHQHPPKRRPPRRLVWFTAKTILGTLSVLLAMAMLGISIKMVVKYGDTGLVHVSFICVGFTAAAAVVWQAVEFIAMCTRLNNRGIYPGAHVGVHICICLACVATMGYVGIWVSDGNHDWKYIEAPGHGNKVVYSPLFHMGIVLLILTVVLLLLNFVLAILACQVVKRKDDAGDRAVVTVRYDGVGPSGTDRPQIMSYNNPGYIYTVREAPLNGLASPPVVITRHDLGREVSDEPPSRTSLSPRPSEKARYVDGGQRIKSDSATRSLISSV